MNTKSKALLLADWLEEQYDPTGNQDRAAAELRRLQTENETLDNIASELQDTCHKQAKRIAEQDALLLQALEALENGKRVRNAEGGTKYQPYLEEVVITAICQHLERK